MAVADDPSQLQKMASEMVDPVDWPLPPPFTEQYPLSATCAMQMSATNPCAIHQELNQASPSYESTTLNLAVPHAIYSLLSVPLE